MAKKGIAGLPPGWVSATGPYVDMFSGKAGKGRHAENILTGEAMSQRNVQTLQHGVEYEKRVPAEKRREYRPREPKPIISTPSGRLSPLDVARGTGMSQKGKYGIWSQMEKAKIDPTTLRREPGTGIVGYTKGGQKKILYTIVTPNGSRSRFATPSGIANLTTGFNADDYPELVDAEIVIPQLDGPGQIWNEQEMA